MQIWLLPQLVLVELRSLRASSGEEEDLFKRLPKKTDTKVCHISLECQLNKFNTGNERMSILSKQILYQFLNANEDLSH